MSAALHIAAAVVCILLSAIASLHLYWAAGGRWGTAFVIPTLPSASTGQGQRVFVPGAAATCAISVLLFAAALLLGAQSGLLPISAADGTVIRWACACCGVVFTLRVIGDFNYFGLFKKVRRTSFALYDTLLFTPLCLLFSIVFFASIMFGR